METNEGKRQFYQKLVKIFPRETSFMSMRAAWKKEAVRNTLGLKLDSLFKAREVEKHKKNEYHRGASSR